MICHGLRNNMVKATSFILDSIRRDNKITDYLTSKGLSPVRESNNQAFYLCPLHGDTNPSFIVYLSNPEGYQTYFCFGCKSHTDIITLYSKMEGISWKDTIQRLGSNLNVSLQDEMDSIIKSLENESESEKSNDISSEINKISLNISVIGYGHYKKTEFDAEELEFLEKLYKKVDELIWQRDVDGLREVYNFILEYSVSGDDEEVITPFVHRFNKWEEKKNKELLECAKVYEKMNG